MNNNYKIITVQKFHQNVRVNTSQQLSRQSNHPFVKSLSASHHLNLFDLLSLAPAKLEHNNFSYKNLIVKSILNSTQAKTLSVDLE